MKFVDYVKIFAKAGHGGKGCVSFRREKHVPRGGPNGGDGGKGGDIVVQTCRNIHTLLDLTYHHFYFAKSGEHGQGADKHGANAPDVFIKVPQGTIVRDAEDGEILADLIEAGETFVCVKGGLGGRGNARFKSAANRAPRFAEEGQEGEERWLVLELKLLADVGLIGYPNTGKSSLLSIISLAKPKIGDYQFTTLSPNLGVVDLEDGNFVTVADVPGLIDGAHVGRGLGLQFLRHIERTRVLVHLLDVSGLSGRDPIDDFKVVNNELTSFNPEVVNKPQIVAANKIDLLQKKLLLDQVRAHFEKTNIPCYPISALTGVGISALISGIREKLREISKDDIES
ncbi:MAG: GTPase ObgE [Candidatus Tectomicrobia bacterium]|uniref:GTPase Obg n=1 Tax=Tectimicrobiota bacterium TaxID=2528274 RepID=A0A933GM34_UNCTE|nr:GTPase ObgE [Candidatus Tectomicrobia bacterium]